jgi:hypothetical protein
MIRAMLLVAPALLLLLGGCEQPSKHSCDMRPTSGSFDDWAVATRQRWSCVETFAASAAMAQGRFDQLQLTTPLILSDRPENVCEQRLLL